MFQRSETISLGTVSKEKEKKKNTESFPKLAEMAQFSLKAEQSSVALEKQKRKIHH